MWPTPTKSGTSAIFHKLSYWLYQKVQTFSYNLTPKSWLYLSYIWRYATCSGFCWSRSHIPYLFLPTQTPTLKPPSPTLWSLNTYCTWILWWQSVSLLRMWRERWLVPWVWWGEFAGRFAGVLPRCGLCVVAEKGGENIKILMYLHVLWCCICDRPCWTQCKVAHCKLLLQIKIQ